MTHRCATFMTVPGIGPITGLCFRAIVAAATHSSDPPQGRPNVAQNPPSSAGTMARSGRVR